MEKNNLLKNQKLWESIPKVQIIKDKGEKKVFVSDRAYMSWKTEDQVTQRVAIVELYRSGISNQEELANIFGVNIKSIYNYINAFENNGIQGLLDERRGPKGSWKLIPSVRGKILYEVLKNNLKEYVAIKNKLEKKWHVNVSHESIRQLLVENGLAKESSRQENIDQLNFWEEKDDKQLILKFNYERKIKETAPIDKRENNNNKSITYPEKQKEPKGKRYYSSAERRYLNRLEQGEYNTYAGALLFLPLLERYNFLPTIKRIIKIKMYEGYHLDQLCLTLFYFDIFGFRSIENFKTAYPEEYGILLGKLSSPSIYTLRRFLHRIRKLGKGEELIEEFGKEYLKNNLVKWGVLYIDSHFLPYYGFIAISMGWYTVRKRPLKGSYNFIANDEEFNPLIFLVRASSEDLLEKIPEIINKIKKLAKEVGIDSKDLTVIFDREGYSAKLFRRLDGKEGEELEWQEEEKVRFITWAKYADKWVNDFDESKFTKEVTVEYKIRKKKVIKYFETTRFMSKYGKIRAIVIENGPDEKRTAIYTNDWESDAGVIIQFISKRWGQENLIKTLKLRHLLDYFPGYIFEELAEQPMVDNPKKEELKKQKARLVNQLHKLELKLAEKIINETKDETSWKEIRQAELETLSDITGIKSQITLIDLEISDLPDEIKFDEAHDGKKLLEMDYEKKLILDCIKVFAYHMEKKMCEILFKYYDRKKELWPALAMIIRRGAYVKIINGKLTVKLRRFKNPEINYVAMHLCEELNHMDPTTLDKFHFPVHYEVL